MSRVRVRVLRHDGCWRTWRLSISVIIPLQAPQQHTSQLRDIKLPADVHGEGAPEESSAEGASGRLHGPRGVVVTISTKPLLIPCF